MTKILTIKNLVASFATAASLAASSAYAAPVLSQSSVTVGPGQTTNVTSQVTSGYDGVYMSYSSNSAVASVQTTDHQIAVTGVQPGSASINICYVGTASDCTNLNVIVDANTSNNNTGTVSMDNANPSVATGNTTTANIAGGSDYYISANSNSNVASASINGSVITFSGLQSGSTTITVCSASNGCISANVTVTASSASYSNITFGTTNPTVGVGQTISVTISGGEKYFIFSNSNNNIVQAVVKDDSRLSIYGVNAGSASLKICIQSQSDNCNTLQITVTSAPVVSQPITTATVIQSPTVTTPVAQNSSISEILTAIQTMQNQLVQMLSQIQSMTSKLTNLTANLTTSIGTTQTNTGGTVAGATSPYFFTQFLSVGTEGAEVTALQQKLTSLGFYSGPVTGYFGPLTETAVSAYQAARGISPLGFVGPGTRAALNGE